MREAAIAVWGNFVDQRSFGGVVGIGTDGKMYFKLWSEQWRPSQTDWLSLEGQFDSHPATAAAVRGEQFLPSGDVFGVGLDNQAYWLNVLPSGNLPPFGLPVPGTWQPIGGIFNSPIAARAFGFASGVNPFVNDSTALVGLGADNQPFIQVMNSADPKAGGTFPGWVGLGGILITEVACASFPTTDASANTVELYGLGTDAQMYRLQLDGSVWPPKSSGWQPAGGCFIAAPSATKWSPSRTDVFGIGSDKQMYHRAFENGAWIEDWEPLGGAFDSPPEAVAWGNNRLDLFGLGTDDRVYHKYWAGGPWMPSQTDWTLIGAPPTESFISAPCAFSSDVDLLDLFAIGADNQMYHKAWRGGPDWSPPQLAWEALGGSFKVPGTAQKPSRLDFDAQITFASGIAVGGSAHVTVSKDGTCTYSGQLHDSGAIGYTVSVACVVQDSKGVGYSFATGGDVSGTLSLGGSRDFKWSLTANSAVVAANWDEFFGCGGASARFKAQENVDVVSLVAGLTIGIPSVIGIIK